MGKLLYVTGAGPNAVITQINVVSNIMLTIMMMLTYLLVLLSLSPWLLVAALVMGGLISLVQQQLLPRIRNRSYIGTELQQNLSSRITENIQGLRLLHTSGELDKADQVVRDRTGDIEFNKRAATRLDSITAPINTFLPILMIAGIAGLSLLLFGSRNSGVLPSLVTFVVALQRLNNTFGSIASSLGSLNTNAAPLVYSINCWNPPIKSFVAAVVFCSNLFNKASACAISRSSTALNFHQPSPTSTWTYPGAAQWPWWAVAVPAKAPSPISSLAFTRSPKARF